MIDAVRPNWKRPSADEEPPIGVEGNFLNQAVSSLELY